MSSLWDFSCRICSKLFKIPFFVQSRPGRWFLHPAGSCCLYSYRHCIHCLEWGFSPRVGLPWFDPFEIIIPWLPPVLAAAVAPRGRGCLIVHLQELVRWLRAGTLDCVAPRRGGCVRLLAQLWGSASQSPVGSCVGLIEPAVPDVGGGQDGGSASTIFPRSVPAWAGEPCRTISGP